MRKRRLLLCGGVWLALAGGLCAAQQTRPELPDELRIVPDMNPMPSLEVVTTRKAEDNPPRGLLVTTMKAYILNAYSMSPQQEGRLIGGPSWLGSQKWVINGKPSDEQRDAMKKMTPAQQVVMGQMQRRSVLADLFKLKMHIETRQMQYFELVPAKGGLKIKEVPAFVPPAPGTPPPQFVPGGPMPPGMMMIQNKDGKPVINARAVTMSALVGMIMRGQEVDGRPIVDKTGFKGRFDLVDMQWAGMLGGMNGGAAPAGDEDAPSIFTAVQEQLGLKLQPAKGPVEVVVIDSIELPSEN